MALLRILISFAEYFAQIFFLAWVLILIATLALRVVASVFREIANAISQPFRWKRVLAVVAIPYLITGAYFLFLIGLRAFGP